MASSMYEHCIGSGSSQNHFGHNYYNNCYTNGPAGASTPSRCISIPFTTVPNYTERPHLSNALCQHLSSTKQGAGVAQAVAVVGIGGTGKTQLVLRYFETHEKEYETILWIDARSEETARSSFERCCGALRLPAKAPASDKSLQNSPAVQAVLSFLQNVEEGKRWLAIVDNADDLSWGVSSIVPKGREGSVIITSQDNLARRLLGGHIEVVKVDAMEKEEAVSLISSILGSSTNSDDACGKLTEEIVELLDGLPLAIDLASARIRADVEYGDELEDALRRYLSDFRSRQEELLRDEEYAKASPYKKTVWTVWDASLASIQKIERKDAGICATNLLSFLAFFDRANVQDKLFELASSVPLQVFVDCEQSAPQWLLDLVKKAEDGKWDDTTFRSGMRILVRYGLVRRVNGEWKGATMHSLVQWRATVGINQAGYRRWSLVFLTAACCNSPDDFRRCLLAHIPANNIIMECSSRDVSVVQPLAPVQVWQVIGATLLHGGRFAEARQLHSQSVKVLVQSLGEDNPKTLAAKSALAKSFSYLGLSEEAAKLYTEVLEVRKKVLCPKHADTLASMQGLATTRLNQGRSKDAASLAETVLEGWKDCGNRDSETLESKQILARAYRLHGREKEAERLEVGIVEAQTHLFGRESLNTLRYMNSRAHTFLEQGRLDEAKELLGQAAEKLIRALGKDHPDSIKAIKNQANLYLRQNKAEEAEQQADEAFQVSMKVLPKDHYLTLECMSVLGAVLSAQGRGEKAEELGLAAYESYSRVFGEEARNTLTAMANLADIKYRRGKAADALGWMRKSAAMSVKILGEDHPETIRRCKWVANRSSDSEIAGGATDVQQVQEAHIIHDDDDDESRPCILDSDFLDGEFQVTIF